MLTNTNPLLLLQYSETLGGENFYPPLSLSPLQNIGLSKFKELFHWMRYLFPIFEILKKIVYHSNSESFSFFI